MARRWWTLLTVCLGMLLLLIDITIVNVALPSISKDLGASLSDLQWTIDAYALSLAGAAAGGRVAGDLLGHRRVFAAGVVFFTASSLTCGLATSPVFLVASRAAPGSAGRRCLPARWRCWPRSSPAATAGWRWGRGGRPQAGRWRSGRWWAGR
jgi:MFS family permease